MVMHRVVRPVPYPEKPVHDVFVREPGDKFQKRNVPIVMSEQSAMVDSVVIADGIGLRVPGIDGQKYGLLHA